MRRVLLVMPTMLAVHGSLCGLGETYSPLFVIERSLNKNVVHYDARLTPDGKIDPKQPVIAYWTMDAENGRRQELNFIERTRAFGFSTRPDNTGGSYTMTIVSDRKRAIRIAQNGTTARAETNIGGSWSVLHRIYVTTHTSMLLPVADFAELYGEDAATGEPRYEKVSNR